MAPAEEIPYEVTLKGLEGKDLTVEGFANFLRDLVFLHDRLWLLASEEHAKYNHITGRFFIRGGRPVPPNQALRLHRVKKESPWELTFTIESALYASPVVGLILVRLFRALVLLPGEIERQDLVNEQIRLQNEQLRRSLALRPSVPSEKIARLPSDIADEIAQLPGLQGEKREENYRRLERDIERISDHGLAITDVEIGKKREE